MWLLVPLVIVTAVMQMPPAHSQPTQPAGVPAKVADLGWLAGGWQGEMWGMKAEEHWARPSGGAVMAMFRLGADTPSGLYEFILAEEDEDGKVRLRIHHYLRPMKAREAAPVTFTVVEIRDGFVRFARTGGGFPTSIAYERVDAMRLTIRLDDNEYAFQRIAPAVTTQPAGR